SPTPCVLSHPESAKLHRNVADRNPRYRDRLAIEDLHAMYLVQRLPLRLKSSLRPRLCSCHSRVRDGSFQSYWPPLIKNLGLDSAKSLCHFWPESRPDCSAKYAELNACGLRPLHCHLWASLPRAMLQCWVILSRSSTQCGQHESRLFFRLCRFGRIGYRRTDDFCSSMGYAASAGECT